MPALTRKAKRRHFESEEEGNSSDNEGEGGILAQRAARRLAARQCHHIAATSTIITVQVFLQHTL